MARFVKVRGSLREGTESVLSEGKGDWLANLSYVERLLWNQSKREWGREEG